MQEQVPNYFKEFVMDFSEFKKNVTNRFDKVDDRLVKIESRLDIVEEKIDSHFEVIGEMKIQITDIHQSLPEKASHEYVVDIDKRTKKLEKLVFA
jgi:hypothetical protein